MDDIPPTPASGGGNSKYAVIGLVMLLAGGGGIYFLMQKPPETPRDPPRTGAPARDAAVVATPQVAPPIELPPEEPDAGPPPDVQAPRIRYVTRYVGGCNGTIDMPRVQATAQSNYGGLRSCYEHELRANPQLRGRLAARMMINTSGRVEDVSVSTAMASRPLVACVKRTLQGVAFPPARGGCAIAEVSFNFAPRE